jgi:hypothetical protein
VTASFKVEFDAPLHGWIELSLSSAEMEYKETFSHIYPSLQSLCCSLCDVATGARARPVVLLLGAAELELTFSPIEEDFLELQLLCYADHLRPPTERREPRTEFHARASRSEIVLAFWRALRRLETSVSPEEWLARWREPFPAREMISLTGLVARFK